MDIMLERILSLIPKKPDGSFQHGAKKKFATSIGYGDGQIISMWENGSSFSYKKKLHEISSKHNVSVEWLKGETDIKKSPVPENRAELSEIKQRLIAEIESADMDEATAKAWLQLIESQKK